MLPLNKIPIVVALVLAAAVVFILVTPDPTDDVDGVLQIGKQVQVQVPALVSALYVALYARERSYVATGPNPERGLLELLCARRC